jgi:2,3-bisphosphoglycerate-independent phosphoglycerate mutase
VLITADHGNLELMLNPDGSQNVSHTTNPVPLILVSNTNTPSITLQPGNLADLAPTILSIFGISSPDVMTGKNLVCEPEMLRSNKVLLVILDGWGIGKNDQTNPIFLANTPYWDKLLKQYPSTQLNASGENVGLLSGKAGNSEAGHMNIGAGRVVLQDDVRLDLAMKDGSFYTNEILCRAIEDARQRQASLHLIGLLTEKSSHGCIDYPLALLRMAKARGLNRIYLHVIFDGRSTEPGSAPALLEKLESQIEEIGVGQIVSGVGRGIALDRDGNYARTKRAYDALVYGVGRKYAAPLPG